MISAQAYRDRAERLLRLAEEVVDDGEVRELVRLASEWRKLALLADWQEAVTTALARVAAEGP